MSTFHTSHRVALADLTAVLVLAGCSKDSSNPLSPAIPADFGLYVNVATGSDSAAGTSGAPFKTLTYAIAAAGVDAVIHVAAGTYDAASGETFPLVLQPGQTIVGDTTSALGAGPSAPTIQGKEATPGTNPPWPISTIVAADGTTLAGLHITGGMTLDHFCVQATDVRLTFAKNTIDGLLYGGLALQGAGACLVRGNIFGSDCYGVYIANRTDSLIVQDNAFTTCFHPLERILTPGRLLVRRNTFAGAGAVNAIGNTRQHDPPTAGTDIVVANGCSVRWGTGAGDVVQ